MSSTLALAVDELVEWHEHLDAEVAGHVVAGRAAEFADTITGRDDVVGVGDAHGRLDVGSDFDGAGTDAALGFQTGDDLVHAAYLVGVFGLGIVDHHEAGPDDGVEVGFHEIVG